MIAKKSPRALSWSLIAIILAMPIWPFVSTWFGSIFALELWKSLPTIVLVCAGIATIIYLVIHKRELLRKILRDRLILLIIIFAILVVISLGLSVASHRAKLAGLAMDLRYFITFILAFIAAKLDPKFWENIMRKVPIFAIWIGVGLSVIGLVQTLFLPADFLVHFGYGAGTIMPSVTIDAGNVLRAFATLRGPNDYAAFLIIPLFFAIWRFAKTKNAWFAAAILTISAGIFASSSRSAWIGAGVGIVVMIFASLLTQKTLRNKKFWVSIGGIVAVLVVIGLFVAQIPYVKLNVLHIRADRTSTITSNDAHADALQNGIEKVAKDPIGCGVGCAGPASFYSLNATISENYYLQIAEQYGILGLLVWLGIIVMIMIKLWPSRREETAGVWFVAMIAYLIIGALLHVFADEPLAIVWFTIAGILIAKSEELHKV